MACGHTTVHEEMDLNNNNYVKHKLQQLLCERSESFW